MATLQDLDIPTGPDSRRFDSSINTVELFFLSPSELSERVTNREHDKSVKFLSYVNSDDNRYKRDVKTICWYNNSSLHDTPELELYNTLSKLDAVTHIIFDTMHSDLTVSAANSFVRAFGKVQSLRWINSRLGNNFRDLIHRMPNLRKLKLTQTDTDGAIAKPSLVLSTDIHSLRNLLYPNSLEFLKFKKIHIKDLYYNFTEKDFLNILGHLETNYLRLNALMDPTELDSSTFDAEERGEPDYIRYYNLIATIDISKLCGLRKLVLDRFGPFDLLGPFLEKGSATLTELKIISESNTAESLRKNRWDTIAAGLSSHFPKLSNFDIYIRMRDGETKQELSSMQDECMNHMNALVNTGTRVNVKVLSLD